MRVTIAICTWNRADLLNVALHSMARVAVPKGVEWQVIVADNNSSDQTQRVLASHATRLPLTNLFVDEQGKSHALNAIIERLDGDIVIWTDDDVLFDPHLIESYVDAAHANPVSQFFGGWVVPRFLASEPEWLRPAWRTLSGVFAARELGNESFDFTPKVLPFGANMAARVPMQKRYRYDPELGRIGELLLAGEETALMHQWLADGLRGVWVPNARVEHLITPDRMEIEHIRRFFFSLGQSKRVEAIRLPRAARLMRGAWHVLRSLQYAAMARCTSIDSSPAKWIKCQSRMAYLAGRLDAEWHDFPESMLPQSVKRMKTCRAQPRSQYADLAQRLLAELLPEKELAGAA